MKHVLRLALGLAVVVGLAGCAGSTDQTLAEGEYESDISPAYLQQHGLTAEHAQSDGGTHRLTFENGSFTDQWTNGAGEDKFCTGTYKEVDGRVTFTWISGCFGDWSARYTVDGDEVTWSDMKALPPHDSAEDQRQAEIFNAVPWTRTGEAR